MDYHAYLKTDAWRARRDATLKRYGYRCALCNSPDNLHVHHRTYKRLGNELPDDLIALCEDCHERHHKVMPVWYSWLGRVSSEIFKGVRW